MIPFYLFLAGSSVREEAAQGVERVQRHIEHHL